MQFRSGQPALDLNGQWLFAYSEGPVDGEFSNAEALQKAGVEFLPASVPGNLELDLQAIGTVPEPFFGMNIAALRRYEAAHVWYVKDFEAAPEAGFESFLNFEGIDCCARIFLNGVLLGETDNMLIPHQFSVDHLLQGNNQLVIHIRPAVEEARKYEYPPSAFHSPCGYESLYVRKAPSQYGWDIMPRAISAGLWRTVTLQRIPDERLDWVHLETRRISANQDSANLFLSYRANLNIAITDTYEILLEGECEKSHFTQKHPVLFESGSFSFHLEHPSLWWPRDRGSADLYSVRASLLKNGEEIDYLTFNHGIRTVELLRTGVTDASGSGEFVFKVNGEKLFIRGTNWVPVDAYHSRDAARIPAILDLVEDIGCNMIRCWGGNVYENDLFFDICDRKGILVWQDFAMACGVYPQDDEFQKRLGVEAKSVVRRLRQHACLALWAGDNECDESHVWAGGDRDANRNVLTRKVLPEVLHSEDLTRPYLPSSPYMDADVWEKGRQFISEDHLWGPRDYYKGSYYTSSLCHFASEIGYHGCPAPESLKKFLSPEHLWPSNNSEWILHSTSPIPGVDLYDYRVELMRKQVRELFGSVPDSLEDFTFASQASQAEAKKFFVEMFRAAKWRRTGIIWWNIMDGWPQMSDAVVDYYFVKKLAYHTIKRAQNPLCLILKEPENWGQSLIASNDTRDDLIVRYSLKDADTGEILAEGEKTAKSDAVTPLARIPYTTSVQRFYLLHWSSSIGEGDSHYLCGNPPFDLERYRSWLKKAKLL